MFSVKNRERCKQLYDKHYSGVRFHDDFYREFIHKYLPPGGRLLDAGCGRYLKFSKELARKTEVVGIDLESKLETRNEGSPFGVRGDLNHLPFEAGYFDLIISRFVVEHLERPAQVFGEFHRVLKPGGKVVLLTPGKYDYVSLIAAATPYSWHRSLVSRIFRVSEDDVYPTFYRANTPAAIAKELESVGLRKTELRMINHYPAYLMFSPFLFRVGMAYERLTRLEMFKSLRAIILCTFEKDPVRNDAPQAQAAMRESKLTALRT
jgi:SAM-dependent methyltransferase